MKEMTILLNARGTNFLIEIKNKPFFPKTSANARA